MTDHREAARPTRVTITGHVFNDTNGDGAWNIDERGLGGRIIFADTNGNGVRDEGETFARSRPDGLYTLRNAPLGDYDVIGEVRRGWHATSPSVAGYGYDQVDARYRFVELAGTMNPLSFSNLDNGRAEFTHRHDTPFFGDSYSVFYVSTNGFLSFIDYKVETPTGTTFPDAAYPNGIIAPLWADFDLALGGAVYALDDTVNSRFVIEWKDVVLKGDLSGERSTFEAVIGYDGEIRFAYKEAASAVQATIGVENLEGTSGVQITEMPTDRSSMLLTPKGERFGVVHINDADPGERVEIDFGQARGPAPSAQSAHAIVLPSAFAEDDVTSLRGLLHQPALGHAGDVHVMLV